MKKGIKKYFKQFLLLSLCVCTIFALSSCFADTEDDDDKTSEPTSTEATKEETIDDKINDMVDDMTLEEKVGQMFMVRCPSDGTDVSAIKDYNLGSYILFATDFEDYSEEQVKDHIAKYQSQAKIPMLIGVDEEGGTVNRVSCFTQFRDTPFQSPRELYAQGGLDAVKTDAKEKCQLLSNLGINVNFAPVCDISTDSNDFIYDRSLGESPEDTGTYAKAMVEIGLENNMGAVLKHFPGYGNNTDTHTGIAYDKRDMSTFENSDFIPFKTGSEGGECCVLVAHNIVDCMDSEMPASLSKPVHKILRDELGFTGVIMTDDLSMGAITEFCGSDAAAVTAVKAGNDMLCCDDYQDQVPAVINAVKSGDIDEDQISDSVHRILAWKNAIGLLDL